VIQIVKIVMNVTKNVFSTKTQTR